MGATPGATGAFPGDPSTSTTWSLGAEDYVSLPTNLLTARRGPISISAWFQTYGSGPIFGYQSASVGATPANYVPLLYVGYDGRLYGDFWPSPQVVSPSVVNDGVWHHVVLTDDGSIQTLYLDGNDVSDSAAVEPNWLNMANDQIGAADEANWVSPTNNGWSYFWGAIQDVAIYSSALDAAQAASQYQASLPPYDTAVRADTPTSMWPLDEPATNKGPAADMFGLNPGQYIEALPGFDQGPLTASDQPSPAFGINPSTVQIPDATDLEFSNNQAFSLEVWVNTTMTSGSEAVMSKMANASPYQGWELGLTNGKPYFYLINNYPSNNIYATGSSTLSDGNWHHLVVTYDGSSRAAGVTFYIDGAPIADTITYDNLNASSQSIAPMEIGSRANNALFFSGSIADAAIYPYALNSNQIALHHQEGLTAPGPAEDATYLDSGVPQLGSGGA